MASCIAFHSYKGGTGKTTIAANLAALLAKKGYRVFLLDLDVYAPSLQAYFDKEPKRWINDFLNGTAEVGDVIMDLTSAIEEVAYDSSNTLKQKQKPKEKITGKLWVGFCSSRKEEIYKLEGGGGKQDTSKIQLLRRFILLREQLISLHDADYIIIDTSPGIRYWSINALAVADTLFLTLKMGDLDIDGTRKMAEEIYGSFTKFGAKSYLVMNRVAGYCVPQHISDVTVPLPPSSAVSTDGGSGRYCFSTFIIIAFFFKSRISFHDASSKKMSQTYSVAHLPAILEWILFPLSLVIAISNSVTRSI